MFLLVYIYNLVYSEDQSVAAQCVGELKVEADSGSGGTVFRAKVETVSGWRGSRFRVRWKGIRGREETISRLGGKKIRVKNDRWKDFQVGNSSVLPGF